MTLYKLSPQLLKKIEIPNIDCWPWTACTNDLGNPVVACKGGKNRPAWQVVYELVKGPLPPYMLRRTCDQRRCVNPQHREHRCPQGHVLGDEHVCQVCHEHALKRYLSQRTSTRPYRPRAKKVICCNGHPKTPSNVYSSGHCKLCRKATNQQRSHKNDAVTS